MVGGYFQILLQKGRQVRRRGNFYSYINKNTNHSEHKLRIAEYTFVMSSCRSFIFFLPPQLYQGQFYLAQKKNGKISATSKKAAPRIR